jgi:phosphoribosylglycinamide formyltransferase-1/phosphoribosylamine--glycine ligase/phosphoribosylglycinamide formyltransferase/phosphoribosylformylglycinamidine cyclo-ligase
MKKARVAILISGTGSNMVALIEAARAPACPFEIVCVISNKPEASGLDRARNLGVEAIAVDQRPFGKDRAAHELAIQAELTARNIEWVVLAGYMRLLTPGFVDPWQGRMLNIHPSLLPKYPGLDTHRRALEAGDTEAGCTVHHVVAEMDAGPIIAQVRVPILGDDTPESVAARVLAAEHRLYPSSLVRAIEKSV